MYSLPKNVYRERIDFSKIKTTVPIPNLIEIQKKSYERFLQMNRLASEREDAGLQSVFKSVFPISDFRENSSLEFIEYSIGNWECKCGKLQGLHHLRKPCAGCGNVLIADPYGDREVLCPRCGRPNIVEGDVCDICGNTVALKLKYDVDECQERGMTFAVPLKVTIRLVVWNKDPETGAKTIRDIKEQEVYFGDIPLMTENGTFIINGTERVIVSQLHRSPGAFFHSEDKTLFVAQIIPYRGSWVEFEYDAKNLLYVRIDRKRKFLASVFLRALGLRGHDEIIRSFYTVEKIYMRKDSKFWAVSESLVGLRAGKDITIPKSDIDDPGGQEDHQLGHRGAPQGQRRSDRDLGCRARGRVRRVRHRQPGDRRGHPRGQRRDHAARDFDGAGEQHRSHRGVLPREATTSARSSRRRSRRIRFTRTKSRSSRSTAACGRAIPRRSTARGRSSRTCSSTRRSTTSRASAA